MKQIQPQSSRRIPIAKDGWRFIMPLAALGMICLVLGWGWTGGFFFLLAAACVGFFRDPERTIPSRTGLFLSPADGKVISIGEIEIETGGGRRERLRRVGIFLSVFNAHVQRTPAAGTVRSVRYNPGKFINALSDKASDENENNLIWIESAAGTIGVRQIAGVIARRVVCTCRPGMRLRAGQRLGLIRFGSRAEAYFPLEARIQTRLGQHVKAGLSVLAEMPQGTPPPEKP